MAKAKGTHDFSFTAAGTVPKVTAAKAKRKGKGGRRKGGGGRDSGGGRYRKAYTDPNLGF